MMNDIFGQAMSDFYYNQNPEDITVRAKDFDDDLIPVDYLFRSFDNMPLLEQEALQLTKGSVLDVGCGAGSHSLYLQNEKKLEVTAIDNSPKAIEICKQRGIKNAFTQNIFEFRPSKSFDTVLLLMNGTGFAGNLSRLDIFLNTLKSIIKPEGQILIDSSDLSYLYEDEEGSFWMDLMTDYYGEMSYQLEYKGLTSNWFDWLYLDFRTLMHTASKHGLNCKLVMEGEHYDYLALLTLA